MDEYDEEFDDSVVENLVGFVFRDVFFGDIFLDELEQITEQLKVQIPILVLFEESGEEVFVADEFDPGEGEVGVEERIDFMELLGQNVVKSGDFFLGEVVLLASGVAN